ncbi:MAG: hypothetical protein BAJALOKI2v1_10002 [Promethearchaeota archaeon]|nr:MAG: hypothetical protein BAJALOKI2v1_10002 [Candidatus Lokiarchaeota archaeon]
MSNSPIIIYDAVNGIINPGSYKGSIISKFKNERIIFSDNIEVTPTVINIINGLLVGLKETKPLEKEAFSEKSKVIVYKNQSQLEYSIKIPEKIIKQFDEGRFSESFPFTINLLHSAILYYKNPEYKRIDHLDFFKGEIVKNPVAVISNGVCLGDRVVINQDGDPVFYDTLIIGRNEYDELLVSYEPFLNIDDELFEYIVILGTESLEE